jgi:hypothetical protein
VLNQEIPVQYSAEEVHVYIGEISETLKPLSLEFKARNDEVTGKKIWAMVGAFTTRLTRPKILKDVSIHDSDGTLFRSIR